MFTNVDIFLKCGPFRWRGNESIWQEGFHRTSWNFWTVWLWVWKKGYWTDEFHEMCNFMSENGQVPLLQTWQCYREFHQPFWYQGLHNLDSRSINDLKFYYYYAWRLPAISPPPTRIVKIKIYADFAYFHWVSFLFCISLTPFW